MDEKLLPIYFGRRKETTTRLLVCMSVAVLLAAASRIPILFVSLPASWISGGLSIAFIWVFGPFVLLFLQVLALQSQAASEGFRELFLSSERLPKNESQSQDPRLEALAPQWGVGFPITIRGLTLLLWLAPVAVNGVLFFSYLNFVRPDSLHKPRYQSRSMQMVDAFTGSGGWHWFQPLAPSLQDNLETLRTCTANIEEQEKYRRLKDEIPWVFFPVQTWFYVFLLLVSLDTGITGIEYARGKSNPEGLLKKVWKKYRQRATSKPVTQRVG